MIALEEDASQKNNDSDTYDQTENANGNDSQPDNEASEELRQTG